MPAGRGIVLGIVVEQVRLKHDPGPVVAAGVGQQRPQTGGEGGAEHEEFLPCELHQRLHRAAGVVAVHREHIAPIAEIHLLRPRCPRR